MHARDPADLYKDKIEVSLDGRQIFYLFFGGAVIVGLVFVLGVMVGRRVEARGHVDPAPATAARDPLAALDRLEAPGGLSFKGALTGTPAPTEVERAIAARAPRPEPRAAAAVVPAPRAEKKPEPRAEKKPEPAPRAEKKPEPEPRAEKKPEPEPRAEKKPEPPERAERVEPKEPKRKKKPEGEAETRFTLQLSSFQDRQEAEAFMAQLKAAGFSAYVTQTDVGGKGTFYRVRFGSYRTSEAAAEAKAELERVTKKNASVMRL